MTSTSDGARRGVSLYSFQQLYYLREKTLEELIEITAGFGATGIETLGEQMMPGFPDLPDAFYAQWREWMKQYGTTPSIHDGFFDTLLHKDRPLTEDESVAMLRRDIEHAAKLGCRIARTMHLAPHAAVEQVVPDLERHDVTLVFEIHNPRHFDDDQNTQWLPLFERYPGRIGYLLDLGIFVRRLPRVMMERFLRDGAQERVVQHIVDRYDEAIAAGDGRVFLEELPDEVEQMSPSEVDRRIVNYASRFIWEDPERIRDFVPHIHHVHAKFWEMTDAGSEYSIPYEQVVPILIDAGYRGWISSEYEGQRHVQDVLAVDEIEQVRRHQEMLTTILARSSNDAN
jgi:sugar phosphate isomerase/epimerase